ncbi:hypothetical protein QE152_g10292 [Popillia japonica]|uniref:Uncharacterized protein n=1 Tax=Popillia japonica TaxID=7064 RepID=A0AAW1LS30_POPJA
MEKENQNIKNNTNKNELDEVSKEGNPFERRDSLSRSPPESWKFRERSHSLQSTSNLGLDEENPDVQRTYKRKKTEATEKAESLFDSMRWIQSEQPIEDKIEELCKTVKTLRELCRAHPYTKTEIKAKVEETWIKVTRLRLSEIEKRKSQKETEAQSVPASANKNKTTEKHTQTEISATHNESVATQTAGTQDEINELVQEDEQAQNIDMRATTKNPIYIRSDALRYNR